MPNSIYLDYNATSPLRPEVREAMHAVDAMPLNPSSVHTSGRRAKRIIEDARVAVAETVCVFPHEVRFVGSGTEANNQVLRSFAESHSLLVAATEHASIHKTGQLLGAAQIPVQPHGLLDLEALESQLTVLGERKALVSVMLANNETGVIQPIADISAICRKHGALLHVDAVQALGKMSIDCGTLGADMLTLCAHKTGGPVGIGVLVVRDGVMLTPMFTGGGQEQGHRAGTENVAAIAGLQALLRAVKACPESDSLGVMRNNLETRLTDMCPEARVFGVNAPRLPNTLQITMPGVSSETQLMHFDLAGIEVSAGSACSSGRVAPSHVLLAMGVPEVEAGCAVRISLGWGTNQEHVDAFVQAWETLYKRILEKAA